MRVTVAAELVDEVDGLAPVQVLSGEVRVQGDAEAPPEVIPECGAVLLDEVEERDYFPGCAPTASLSAAKYFSDTSAASSRSRVS